MNITSDHVKSALLIGGAIVGGLFAYGVYKRISEAGQSVSGAFESVWQDTKREIAEAFAEAEETITTDIPAYIKRESDILVQEAKRVAGMDSTAGGSTAEWQAPGYVTELAPAAWDLATKQFIKSVSKSRGTYATGFFGFDYSGWRVFSDGTVIDPLGNYYQMNYTGQGMSSPYGFSVTGIYTAADSPFSAYSYDITDATPDVFKLPSAKLLEQ